MPRRRRTRRTYSILRSKYSNETYAAQYSFTLNNESSALTYATIFTTITQVMGTRKAKNFTLNSVVSGTQIPLYFALVFVPQGTDPSNLNFGNTVESGVLLSSSLYEPNQNVIMSGIIGGPMSQVERHKTRLARNLNSGDRILLVFRPLGYNTEEAQNVQVAFTLNYVISY